MASFIPHHTKREQFLERKETQLRRLLESDAGEGELFRAGWRSKLPGLPQCEPNSNAVEVAHKH